MSMLNEARRGSLTDDRDRSFMGRVKEIVPWKGDDIKEILRKIVFIGAVCVLVYSGYDAYIFKFGSQTMKDDQRELSSLYHNPDLSDAAEPSVDPVDNTADANNGVNDTPSLTPDSTAVEPDGSENVQTPQSKYPEGMLPNYKQIYDLNPDVVGWIMIDGLYLDDEDALAIDYPVLQGEDNDYYLEHDFLGIERSYGSIYADYRAVVSGDNRSDNVTLYGHNMATGRYFAKLRKYNDKESASFVREHRIIKFNTLFEEDEYLIFGAFLVSINEKDDNQPLFRYHNAINFNTLADFDYWYKNVMYRNYYITDIDCNMDDEYLTLSTCSYEMSDSRFVVVARKLREGEDPYAYSYRSNPKKHMPEKFYRAFGGDMPEDDGPDYEYYIPE